MNKGFTLMELLAVIALIALLSIITVNVASRQVRSGRSALYDTEMNSIKIAASLWGSDHKDEIAKIDVCLSLTLGYLKQEGYVDTNIKNPLTEKKFKNDSVFVNIEKQENSFKYTALTDKSLMCSEVRREAS